MVNLVKAVLHKDQDPDTAVVIANTGQLVWHCGSGRAMSHRTWMNLPVESAAHPPLKQTYRNVVPRNANWREHVKCVFTDVLAPKLQTNVKIDIIGVEEGGLAAIEYLSENCRFLNILQDSG